MPEESLSVLNFLAKLLKWVAAVPLWFVSSFKLFEEFTLSGKGEAIFESAAFRGTSYWLILHSGKTIGELFEGIYKFLEFLERINEAYVYGPLNVILGFFQIEGNDWLDGLIIIFLALAILLWKFAFNTYGALEYAQFLKEQEEAQKASHGWESFKSALLYLPKLIYYFFETGDKDQAANKAWAYVDKSYEEWQSAKSLAEKTASALQSVILTFFGLIALELALNTFFLIVQLLNHGHAA